MLLEKDAIRFEDIPYGNTERNGKRRTVRTYYFSCSGCKVEISSQRGFLKKHSGKCVRCAQWGDPHRAVHNELIKSALNRNIATTSLTKNGLV